MPNAPSLNEISCQILTPFPNEVACKILTEAIRGRSILRAQRLRLVSKTWKECAPFWPLYLAHIALRTQQDGVSPTLRAIRQAAERVVKYSDPPPANSDAAAAAVREHIIGICPLRKLWMEELGHPDIWGRFPSNEHPRSFINKILSNSEQDHYDQTVMAMAASANQVALIKEILRSMHNVPGDRESVLNFALGVAAYKGYDETVSLFLDAYFPEKKTAVAIVVLYASKGNRLSTLELVLGQECGACTESLCEAAMAHTSSLEIYQKLFARAKERMQGNPDVNYLDLLGDHMVRMARRGAVPILEYLMQLEIPGPAYWMNCPSQSPPNLFQEAARAGQLETVDWFLKRHPAKRYDLAEAVRSGNLAVVQLLLRDDAGADVAHRLTPLEAAVEMEHEEMVRMLLVEGRYSLENERLGGKAMKRAKRLGLESMAELLLECGAVSNHQQPARANKTTTLQRRSKPISRPVFSRAPAHCTLGGTSATTTSIIIPVILLKLPRRMSSFAKLPTEIVHQILFEAVRARGTKRAQRLRFVNRAWKTAVDEAIVRHGAFAKWPNICAGEPKSDFERAPYWPKYTARAALVRPPPGGPETPGIIRRVAERVAKYGHPDTYSDDMLKGYIVEICKMSLLHFGLTKGQAVNDPASPTDPWLRLVGRKGHLKEKVIYEWLLLGAAIWMNQAGLVEELVQSMPREPCKNGPTFSASFYGLSIAAYKGDNLSTGLLFDVHESRYSAAEEVVLEYASKGNNPSTIELFVTPAYEGPYLDRAVFETTSLDVFQRLYPRARDIFECSRTWDELMLAMARRGVLPILDYLFGLYYPDPASPFAGELLETAARDGRAGTVVYLLEKGVPVRRRALEAAVRYGNPALVNLLLKRSSFALTSTHALAIAVEKEDDKVLGMLLEAGATRLLCSSRKEELVAEAREQGLESMEKLLREHWME
ncbi:hypothetical protein PG993_012849 [Apiospora rasikravindrae]|uniref:F-box domain-containing protein n=1 Tax=Apiospora rasikravindrae TaxID=990691 RepID=A0ABR1RVY7_9PEZI